MAKPAPAEIEQRDRCLALSRTVQALAVCLLLAQMSLVVTIATAAIAADGAASTALLAVVWLLALALFVTNVRLVACGTQAERIVHAPLLVNRPDFAVRLAFHLVINWSALAVTLAVAAASTNAQWSFRLAAFCAVASVAVWAGFNVMHRRFNRVRNLILSSGPAAAVVIGAVIVMLRT